MRRAAPIILALATLLAPEADAQPPGKVYRVGVVHQGGPYHAVIDGLRDGLRELGFEEGKLFVLEIRDAKGDLKVVEEAAQTFQREKVDLIYAVTTSTTIVVKRVTADIPIVFYAGTDPVAAGLVESFAKPGGRLTGVHSLATDLTAKRLEILKEIVPKLRRVITFYNPNNPVAQRAAKLGREAGRQLRVEFIERHVASIQELRAGLRALKAREVDAFFYVSDAMVTSQSQAIIDTAKAKGLPTMFSEQSLAAKGGLAAYGISFHEAGRLSAKHVQRILAGTSPKDLPVENYDRVSLTLNLKTAKALGLTIPQSIVIRADHVIQ